MRDEQLLAYLKGSCSGRKNRVGGTELERTLHVSGTDLRKLVNQLRRKTHPIASDRNGYFYATTAGEVYDTIRQLKRMAAGLEAAINGLERSMDRFREDEEAGHGYPWYPSACSHSEKPCRKCSACSAFLVDWYSYSTMACFVQPLVRYSHM